jgi:hypothetical protein
MRAYGRFRRRENVAPGAFRGSRSSEPNLRVELLAIRSWLGGLKMWQRPRAAEAAWVMPYNSTVVSPRPAGVWTRSFRLAASGAFER